MTSQTYGTRPSALLLLFVTFVCLIVIQSENAVAATRHSSLVTPVHDLIIPPNEELLPLITKLTAADHLLRQFVLS
jgi:hypothetical protein